MHVIITSLIHFAMQMIVKGDYLLEIKAHRYENDDHHVGAGGGCCEVTGSTCIPFWCYTCECDNLFVFCLRNSDHDEDGDENDCPLGRYTVRIISRN